MKATARGALAAASTLALGIPALGQAELYSVRGREVSDALGQPVAIPGDMDGDGIDDLVIGTPSGQFARVFSGRSGRFRYEFVGDVPFQNLGSRIAGVGDVDADGVADFVFGAPMPIGGDPSLARVVSGRTGRVLYPYENISGQTSHVGTLVEGAGDANADGYDDFLIGHVRSGTYEVTLYSGQNGSVLRRAINGGAAGRCIGAGDVDGDGADDYAFADTSWSDARCEIRSGRNHRLIRTIEDPDGPRSGSTFGRALAAGDVDGDGTPDLIVGAPYDTSGPRLGGRVYAFSGATGAMLLRRTSTVPLEDLGYAVAAADVDGDGRAEVIAGAPHADEHRGYVLVVKFNGFLYGRVLTTLRGESAGDWFGRSVAAADLTGDGVANLVIGAPGNDDVGRSSGKVTVFGGMGTADPGRWVSYGAPCADSYGRVPRLAVAGRIEIGHTFELTLRSAPFLAFGIAAFGHRAGTPLDGIGMPGCTLWTTTLVTVPFQTTTRGVGTLPVRVPFHHGFIGAQLSAQTFVIDVDANALGIVGSGAVEFRIGRG